MASTTIPSLLNSTTDRATERCGSRSRLAVCRLMATLAAASLLFSAVHVNAQVSKPFTAPSFVGTNSTGPNFTSQATSGPPFQVSSPTQVNNLNADFLNGLHASAFARVASPNTFSATNTFSANNVFSGSNTFSAGNNFSGANTFSGSNTFSAPNTFSANQAFTGKILAGFTNPANPNDVDPVTVFAALPGQAVRIFGHAPMFRLDSYVDGVDEQQGGLCLATTDQGNCVGGTQRYDITMFAQSGNLRFATANQIRMTVSGNGNVGVSVETPSNIFTIGQGAGHAIADGWDTYSSARFKTNIQTYRFALKAITNLRGVTYNRKSDGKAEVGLVAEEVAKVVPQVVSFKQGAAQGIDYSRLTAILVEAVKTQQRELKQQRQEITKLKARLDNAAISHP